MNKINWWPLAKCLTDHLKAQVDSLGKPAFEGIDVYAGTKMKGKKYPCIEITWDGEADIAIHRPIRGIATLWMDIALNNSSPDPAEAYELLYHWQTEAIDALVSWPKRIIAEMGIAAKVDVTEIVSDGDMQRPTCACRLIIKVEWRNSI